MFFFLEYLNSSNPRKMARKLIIAAVTRKVSSIVIAIDVPSTHVSVGSFFSGSFSSPSSFTVLTISEGKKQCCKQL